MAALAEPAMALPVVLDGTALLDIVQRDEERADQVRRGGFVEAGAGDDRPVSVVWLFGEDRD
jgi:hypothetical protein